MLGDLDNLPYECVKSIWLPAAVIRGESYHGAHLAVHLMLWESLKDDSYLPKWIYIVDIMGLITN